MITGQNVAVLYQDDYAVLPHPGGYVQSSSTGWTSSDSEQNGQQGYSVQLNITSKLYWLQVYLQNQIGKLNWRVSLFPAVGGAALIDRVIPILDPTNPNVWLNYDPLAANRIVVLDFDAEEQVAAIELRDEAGRKIFSDAFTIKSFAILPRLVDLGVYGSGGAGIAKISGFAGDGAIFTGARLNARFYDYEAPSLDQLRLPINIGGIPWKPTTEGANLNEGPVTLGSSEASFGIKGF